MNNFIKIDIETASAEEAEVLTAFLSDNQFYAFEEEDNNLIAYIKEEDFDENNLNEILQGKQFKKSIIKDENWNKQWESELQPVVINDFVAIRAFFHEPVKTVQHDLIITPKMSFGTGHHPTTCLMIEQMEAINFKDQSVVDFGTGTGVLAILAEKLGASKVLAIDYDIWSIDNAKENIAANNCKNISIEQRSNLANLEPVDIIIANINLNILIAASSEIALLLKPGGLLLMSGFLVNDENAIEKVFADKGFVKNRVLTGGEWLSVLYQK